MHDKSKRDTINLLNNIKEPQNSFDLFYNWVFSYGKYILIGFEVIVILVFIAKVTVDQEYNFAVQSSQNLQNRLNSPIIQSETRKINAYQSKILTVLNLYDYHYHSDYILNKILALSNPGISMSSITLNNNILTINGTSLNYQDLQTLSNSFQADNKDFSNVLIPSLSDSQNNLSASNITFSLSAKIIISSSSVRKL